MKQPPSRFAASLIIPRRFQLLSLTAVLCSFSAIGLGFSRVNRQCRSPSHAGKRDAARAESSGRRTSNPKGASEYNWWLRRAAGVFVLLIIKRLRAVTFSHQWFQFSEAENGRR